MSGTNEPAYRRIARENTQARLAKQHIPAKIGATMNDDQCQSRTRDKTYEQVQAELLIEKMRSFVAERQAERWRGTALINLGFGVLGYVGWACTSLHMLGVL